MNNEPEEIDDEEDDDEGEEDSPVAQANQAVGGLLGSAASPNHKANVARTTVSYERARKHLIERYGYKDDELDTLFDDGRGNVDESRVVEFYNKTVKEGLNRPTKEIEDGIGWDQDDQYDLPPEEQARIKATKDQKALDAFAARDQSQFKKDARVTAEDLDAARRDINDLLNDEI